MSTSHYVKFGLPAALMILASGCASIDDRQDHKSRDDVNHDMRRFASEQEDMLTREPVVEDIDGLYLGSGKTRAIDQRQVLPAGVDTSITLYDSRAMSLTSVAERIEEATGINVNVRKGVQLPGAAASGGSRGRGSADEMLRQVLSASDPTPDSKIRLEYQGSLSGLLDKVASRFDVMWEYRGGQIHLSETVTRTYELAMMAGDVTQTAEMTNTSGGGGGGGESFVSTSGGLSTAFESESSPWDTVASVLDKLLEGSGNFSLNESTSSVIVSASPSTHDAVEEFVDGYNEILTRQVALNVSVFTLQLDETNQVGFNLDTAYASMVDDYNINLRGPTLGSNTGGEFSASLLESADSRFAGSNLLLQALDEWGETSIVTSTSATILNGQPYPIQDVNRRTYLAETELSQVADAGSALSLTPGTVTTGFSMQVIPQILANDRVLMQYAFTLSSLTDLVELSSGEQTIQGPDVDDRSFTQRTLMPMGGTLVIAGFQRDEDGVQRKTGATGYGRSHDKSKTMVFVTITANKA